MMTTRWLSGLGVFLLAIAMPITTSAQQARLLVHIGTYTNGESEGIYSFILDLSAGELVPHGEVTPAVNPSFLAMHPSHRFLYAVNEAGVELEQAVAFGNAVATRSCMFSGGVRARSSLSDIEEILRRDHECL